MWLQHRARLPCGGAEDREEGSQDPKEQGEDCCQGYLGSFFLYTHNSGGNEAFYDHAQVLLGGLLSKKYHGLAVHAL